MVVRTEVIGVGHVENGSWGGEGERTLMTEESVVVNWKYMVCGRFL